MGMYDYGEIVEAIEQPEPEPEQEPTGGLKDRLRKRRESEATDEEPSDA